MVAKDNYDRYYHILDLKPGATLAEVQDSWRVLSQIWHPDRQEPGTKAYDKALEKQKQINDAYDRLKNLLQGNQSAAGMPPPNGPPPNTPPPSGKSQAPPPKDSSAPPPDWSWPPPGPGKSAGETAGANGSALWHQTPIVQSIVAPVVALFDLADYRGQAVYDAVTGMMDYIPCGPLATLRANAIGTCVVLIYVVTVLFCGIVVSSKLAELLFPQIQHSGSVGLFVGCAILYSLNGWFFGQVTIYKATERPVLQLYHVDETKAIEIIGKTLNDYNFQDYVLGNTSIKHKGKVAAFEAPLTDKVQVSNKNSEANLSLLAEIWPVENAVLIKFTVLVKSPGKFRALASLTESLPPLLDFNLEQAGKGKQYKKARK